MVFWIEKRQAKLHHEEMLREARQMFIWPDVCEHNAASAAPNDNN